MPRNTQPVGRVERHAFEFRADARGVFAPMGLIISGCVLALSTRPLGAAMSDFDVRLLDAAGDDVLYGCGANRRGDGVQRSIVRMPKKSKTERDRHPRVEPGELLRLVITGNTEADARLSLHLFVATDDGSE